MKIHRTINGVNFSFELLPEELCDAYFEQQERFDIEDIVNYGEMMSHVELEENLGCTYSEFISMKEEMAHEMRKYMDKYDMKFAYAREEAIEEVIRRNKVVC